MTPSDNTLAPEPLPPPETGPFWTFRDIGVFIGLAVLSLVAGSLVMKGFWWLMGVEPSPAFVQAPAQVIAYAAMFALLALWFHVEHDRPLWDSLKGEPSRVPLWSAAVNGFATALTVAMAGVLIKVPQRSTPMQELLSDRASLFLMLAIGVTIAPAAEELIFRGLIQPVVTARYGGVAGIVIPAIGFGLIHLPQYGNSWRHALLIAMAGSMFGLTRHFSGSTVASMVSHSAYNLFLFIGFLAAGKAPTPNG